AHAQETPTPANAPRRAAGDQVVDALEARDARVAGARGAVRVPAEDRTDDDRVVAVRNLRQVRREARKRALAIQIKLHVRRVERRQPLATGREEPADRNQRGLAAEIADDGHDEVALLERAHEL